MICCSTAQNLETVACGHSDSVVRVHKSNNSKFTVKPIPKYDDALSHNNKNGNWNKRSDSSPQTEQILPRLDFVGHQGPVYGVDFMHTDNNYFISSSADRLVRELFCG